MSFNFVGGNFDSPFMYGAPGANFGGRGGNNFGGPRGAFRGK